MKDNYVVYHAHSDLSNAFAGTGADSITKFTDYYDRAVDLGMSSIAISEHGSVLSWVKKKQEAEKRGLKYIHANEIYLTKGINQDDNGKLILERDNYHFMLIGKNHEGVKEINTLTSNSFEKDGHYYYNPRITFDELKNTSDNVIMTSACLASPVWRLYCQSMDKSNSDRALKSKMELEELLHWFGQNNNRMFFEIQYHNHPQQIEFNQMLLRLSRELNVPLIAGTDTHALNQEQAMGRQIYLKSKGVNYGDEDAFDLTFKSYDELVNKFEKQNAIPRNKYLEAIHNTNVMSDMVETFNLDYTPKYPKMYEKPIEVFKQKINEGYVKRGMDKFPKEKAEIYKKRIKEELETYVKLDAVDYMLLQKHIIDWCHENKIYQGYGRGSVNGSLIAYILGITEMDSIKHNLNFFRFLNPDRISLPDIDVDFPVSQRQKVIDFLSELDGINFAEIVTFNTIADKGAIRDVGRALNIPLDIVDTISKSVTVFNGKANIPAKFKKEYPELFKYVDILKGTISSIGSHPSGFIVSPISLEDNVSTIYTKESKHRVTALNMKELDGLNYVKLDVLGLANIETINKVCELANIERLTPDNIDTKDMKVWKSLTESTLGVFQWESQSASDYLKVLFSDETLDKIKEQMGEDIDYIEILSFANGAIRPSGDSYRHKLSHGILNDNGHEALNKLLSSTLGFLVYQEQIIKFLTEFCNHTGSEADSVRRGLSKKEGTEQFLPKIEKGFIEHMTTNYGETVEHSKELLEQFLKVIADASSYGFSVNHSSPYSFIGYACAYLRYYYPLEFLTVILNMNKKEDVADINKFMKDNGYKIMPIEYGFSQSYYTYDNDKKVIYKGIASINHLGEKIAQELYEYSKIKPTFDNPIDLLVSVSENTSINSRQMRILIQLDFFKQHFEKDLILIIYKAMFNDEIDFNKFPQFNSITTVIEKKKRTGEIVKELKTTKFPMKYNNKLSDKTKQIRMGNLTNYYNAVLEVGYDKTSIHEQIAFEKETLGYIETIYPNLKSNIFLVLDINKKYTPLLTLLQLKTGNEITVKIKKKEFYSVDESQTIQKDDVIKIYEIEEEDSWKKVEDEWVRNPDRKDMFIKKCEILMRG